MGRRVVRAERVEVAPGRVLSRYERWLKRQPLSGRTRDAYRAQVGGFVGWLASSEHGGAALSDPVVRDWAVRDYKRFVKTKRRWAPTSVNQALAAIDNFYRSLALGRPSVPREDLPQVAPRALEEGDQRALLRAVERCPSTRDRAILLVFFYAGLRLAELTGLDVDDVSVSARRGRLRVRSGKGDCYREVPLNSACRVALEEWLVARRAQLDPGTSAGEVEALW
ncbi:MAG: tyrosine-type recombinase/integrase, partial [Acidimicrobiia bacterium]